MRNLERLRKVNEKAQKYRNTQQAAAEAYDEFLDSLYEVYHGVPKNERPTQQQIAQAIKDIPEFTRGRIAQFLVKARQARADV